MPCGTCDVQYVMCNLGQVLLMVHSGGDEKGGGSRVERLVPSTCPYGYHFFYHIYGCSFVPRDASIEWQPTRSMLGTKQFLGVATRFKRGSSGRRLQLPYTCQVACSGSPPSASFLPVLLLFSMKVSTNYNCMFLLEDTFRKKSGRSGRNGRNAWLPHRQSYHFYQFLRVPTIFCIILFVSVPTTETKKTIKGA